MTEEPSDPIPFRMLFMLAIVAFACMVVSGMCS